MPQSDPPRYHLQLVHAAVQELHKRGVPTSCPVCREGRLGADIINVQLSGFPYASSAVAEQLTGMDMLTMQRSKSSIPMLIVVCPKCTNTQFFNLVKLGLVSG